jgi:hypothetical protein
MLNAIKTQVIARINKETGEEIEVPKQYLLLLFFDNAESNDMEKTFEIIDGKESTFRYILGVINGDQNINLMESRVMSESLPLNKSITLYSFLRLYLEKEKYEKIALDDYDFTLGMLNDCIEYVYKDNEDYEEKIGNLDEFYNKEINQEIDE